MTHNRTDWRRGPRRRRGSITIAVVVSLTVLLGCLALAVDWAYVNMAQVELQRSADAASLAAARSLVHDDQLRVVRRHDQSRRDALQAARAFAAMNTTAGRPTDLVVDLDAGESPDVRIGRSDPVGGLGRSLDEASAESDSVHVTARRSGWRNNPLGLLLGSVLGVTSADVEARAQATLDDRIIGFAPVGSVAAPVVPLAIVADASGSACGDTWQHAIAGREGSDEFGFDDASGNIVAGGDGIPEIELVGPTDERDGNVAVLDFGSRLNDRTVARQMRSGLTPSDLENLGGAIQLDSRGRLRTVAKFELDRELLPGLNGLVGKCRVWCLCVASDERDRGGATAVEVIGFVGARVMRVRSTSDGVAVRIQPCMIVTRSAIAAPAGRRVPRNPYIRKLSLTG
jgi:Flp pilus assembly protein TadG